MSDKEVKDIPYVAFESALAREERHIKRLIEIIITLIVLELATIILSLWYNTLPIETYSEITQETESEDSDVIQHIGDSYGESTTD